MSLALLYKNNIPINEKVKPYMCVLEIELLQHLSWKMDSYNNYIRVKLTYI